MVSGKQRVCDRDTHAAPSPSSVPRGCEKYEVPLRSCPHSAPSVLRNECRLQGGKFAHQGRTPRPTWFAFQLPMDGDITRNLFDDGWMLRDFSAPCKATSSHRLSSSCGTRLIKKYICVPISSYAATLIETCNPNRCARSTKVSKRNSSILPFNSALTRGCEM